MNISPIQAWARRHGISPAAIAELADVIGSSGTGDQAAGDSESRVQSVVRLEAAAKGARLWRNNVGVLMNEDGRPVRYGLANDSKALNQRLKSSDLVGWRRIVVTADMVGWNIAQFVSRECKPQGWKFTGTPREVAQAEWLKLVTLDGGDAQFAAGPGTL